MYKYLEHKGVKHPVRISNSVIGEWQEESGKSDLKKMNFKDIGIVLWYALIEGYDFADREFKLSRRDVRVMVDTKETVDAFTRLIPEFFPKEENSGNAPTPKAGPPAKK